MIARLSRGALSLLMYFLLATLVAQGTLFVYLGLRYHLDRNKLVQILAILQDVDLFAMKEAVEKEEEEVSREQVSYEQIVQSSKPFATAAVTAGWPCPTRAAPCDMHMSTYSRPSRS